MDGSNPVILFTNNLDHVEFLTVDIRENKLYWAVTSTGTVGLLSPLNSLSLKKFYFCLLIWRKNLRRLSAVTPTGPTASPQ